MMNDRRGIEGLPLRLLLVALLLSLSLPALLSAVEGTGAELDDRKMSSLAEDLASTMKELAASGPGNVRTVQMPSDLPTGLYLRLGGAEGSADSCRLSWGNARGPLGSMYLDRAMVLTGNGLPLELRAGDWLRMSCPYGVPGKVLVERT
jgi:hypothetical protein